MHHLLLWIPWWITQMAASKWFASEVFIQQKSSLQICAPSNPLSSICWRKCLRQKLSINSFSSKGFLKRYYGEHLVSWIDRGLQNHALLQGQLDFANLMLSKFKSMDHSLLQNLNTSSLLQQSLDSQLDFDKIPQEVLIGAIMLSLQVQKSHSIPKEKLMLQLRSSEPMLQILIVRSLSTILDQLSYVELKRLIICLQNMILSGQDIVSEAAAGSIRSVDATDCFLKMMETEHGDRLCNQCWNRFLICKLLYQDKHRASTINYLTVMLKKKPYWFQSDWFVTSSLSMKGSWSNRWCWKLHRKIICRCYCLTSSFLDR